MNRRSRRWAVVAQVVCLAMLASAVLAVHRAPDPDADAAEDAVERSVGVLAPLGRRFASGERPDWRAFGRLLEGTAAVVGWAPSVPERARAAFEEASGRDAYRSFSIRERDEHGALRPARPRPQHFPVQLSHPLADTPLLGVDLGADDGVRAAIERARQTGKPQAVPATFACERCVVVLLPVIEGGQLAGVVFTTVPAAAARPAVGLIPR